MKNFQSLIDNILTWDNINKLIIGVITLFLSIIINQWISINRENREYAKWQTGNLKEHFWGNYLSEDIRECRRQLRSNQYAGVASAAPKYQLGLSIQELGFAAYFGTVPLEPILIGNAHQLVSDWLLILDHINHVREQKAVLLEDIPFNRRHGEWLACLCYMWLTYQKFKLPDSAIQAMREFESSFPNLYAISRREKLLFQYERRVAGKSTAASTKEIRKRYKRHLLKMRIASAYAYFKAQS